VSQQLPCAKAKEGRRISLSFNLALKSQQLPRAKAKEGRTRRPKPEERSYNGKGVKASMHTFNLSRIGFLCLLSLVFSFQVFAQEEEILKRRLLMESNNDAVVKALKTAVATKDYPAIEVQAKEIMGNMDQLLNLFPKGSLSEKSRAKAEIWEKWDEFTKYRDNVKKAAQDLAGAAKAQDQEKVEASFNTLGEACASCHKPFRAPRKSG
jgi:cytochrome c556